MAREKQPITQEDIDDVEVAQSEILEAIQTLERVARKIGDEHAKAYLIAPLRIAASEDHGYLTRDPNITEWLKELRDQLEPDNEEDDEEKFEEDICGTCEAPQSRCICE